MATENGSTIGTPRWVKMQGAFVLLLILLVIAMSSGLIGGHGHDYDAPLGHEQHTGGHG